MYFLVLFQPYAVKKLGAVAGVMITASHNPKEDNGYKVSVYSEQEVSVALLLLLLGASAFKS